MDSTAQTIAAIQRDYGTEMFDQNWVASDWTLRDMVGYASSNLFSFYSVPAGQNDPNLGVNKKKEQSNFGTVNQTGGDYFFVAKSLRLFVHNSARVRQLGTGVSTDTTFSARQLAYSRLQTAISSQGVLTWTINQKKYLVQAQPFQTFGAGFGLGVVIPPALGSTTTETGLTGGANAYAANTPYDIDGGGMGDPFAFGQPVVLAPSTTFQIDLGYPLGASPSPANIYGASANQTATIWLACWLVGQKVRPRS